MASQILRDFYDSLNTETGLESLILEGTREDLHVEFKGKRSSSHSRLEESDARQFSRALSGFANSDGGILVWGVVTDGEDRASDLQPISDVEGFLSRLKKSLLNTTQPAVEGVLLEAIPSIADPTSGFVKCLIPTSERAPHRAMLAEREYYKRSTEGFYRLEHFDLEDMFGRRPKARLVLTHRLARRGGMRSGDSETRDVHAIMTIENHGRGSAGAPYLALDVRAPYIVDRFGLDGNGHHGLPQHVSGEGSRVVFGGNSGVNIHSGVSHDVAAIKIPVRFQDGRVSSSPEPLIVDFVLAADGIGSTPGQVVIPSDDILLAAG